MHAVKIKIQITSGNDIAFGPGKADLLEAIGRYGSISAAAKSMNMSYKRAWELVAVINASFKQPLVVTSVGGSHGGGAILTEFGFEVLRLYREVLAKSDQFVLSEMQNLLSMLSALPNPDLTS